MNVGSRAAIGMKAALDHLKSAQHSRSTFPTSRSGYSRPNMVMNQALAGFMK